MSLTARSRIREAAPSARRKRRHAEASAGHREMLKYFGVPAVARSPTDHGPQKSAGRDLRLVAAGQQNHNLRAGPPRSGTWRVGGTTGLAQSLTAARRSGVVAGRAACRSANDQRGAVSANPRILGSCHGQAEARQQAQAVSARLSCVGQAIRMGRRPMAGFRMWVVVLCRNGNPIGPSWKQKRRFLLRPADGDAEILLGPDRQRGLRQIAAWWPIWASAQRLHGQRAGVRWHSPSGRNCSAPHAIAPRWRASRLGVSHHPRPPFGHAAADFRSLSAQRLSNRDHRAGRL